MDLNKTLNRISKSYFFAMVAREAKRLAEADYRRVVRRQLRTMQLDRKHLLRRVGLTSYSPIRSTIGSSLLFIGGAAAGAIIGLSMAPMKGAEFRQQLRGRTMMGRGEFGRTQASAHA